MKENNESFFGVIHANYLTEDRLRLGTNTTKGKKKRVLKIHCVLLYISCVGLVSMLGRDLYEVCMLFSSKGSSPLERCPAFFMGRATY